MQTAVLLQVRQLDQGKIAAPRPPPNTGRSGEQILKEALGDMPPLGDPQISRFYVTAKMVVQNEISAIKRQIAKFEYRTSEATNIAAGAEERIAKKLAAFIEKRINLLVAQKNLKFPSAAERNALIGWATCAAKPSDDWKQLFETTCFCARARGLAAASQFALRAHPT